MTGVQYGRDKMGPNATSRNSVGLGFVLLCISQELDSQAHFFRTMAFDAGFAPLIIALVIDGCHC
jgi:hypothetical protein